MLKRIFILFLLVIVSQSFLIFSAQVNIVSELYGDKTLFTYEFIFHENESYKSFSMEKPKGSSINYILDSESLGYSIAGDFFIFKPKDLDKKNFEISFISEEISRLAKETGSYITYQNFNIEIDRLTYRLIIKDNFSGIREVSPRDHEITEDGDYYWEVENPQKDFLVLVNFDNNIFFPSTSNDLNKLFLLLIIPIFLFIILIFSIKKYNVKEEKKKSKPKAKAKPKPKKKVKEIKEKEKEKIDDEKFEEIKEKYLTENEKQICDIINKNPGILQNDILNHAPQITKSNLSKIISKLHARKILSRIRVGKVNKIYLGERLEKQEESNENSK